MTVLAAVLVASGVLFLLTGALGLVRFPDFYSRMHAAGKCDTLGQLLLMTGLAIHQGFELTSVKLMVVAVFISITSPTATHAIARAAYRNGMRPWDSKDPT